MNVRLGLVALTAMLCRLSALGATTGCRVVKDDRSTIVTAQDLGAFLSTFRVGRMVGPGTSSEVDPTGKLFNADPYFVGVSPVLSKTGCITFSGRVSLFPQYYAWVQTQYLFQGAVLPLAFTFGTGVPLGGVALPLNFQDGLIYQGGLPLSLPVTIRAYLNGQSIWERMVPVPIREGGTLQNLDVSVPLDDKLVRNLKFAWQKASRGGHACTAPQAGEENCPATNSLQFTYTVPEPFEVLGIGLSAPGVIAKMTGGVLNFSAMAPVFLATGCCGATIPDSFDNAQLPYTLAQSFRDAKVPFYVSSAPDNVFNQPIRDSIEVGGQALADRLVGYSKLFGTKWIHVVGHSKGGLSTRYILGRKLAESKGIGIRSLVTLNTPHLGSAGADLAAAIANGVSAIALAGIDPMDAAWLIVGAQDRVKNDLHLRTQGDLNQNRLSRFNSDPLFKDPPRSTTVGSVTRSVVARTAVSDANADGSQENQDTVVGNVRSYGRRDISNAEARAYAGCSANPYIPCFVTPFYQASAATLAYNFLGKIVRVDVATSSPPRQVKYSLPIASNAAFRFSDAVVTVESQAYGGHLLFPSLSAFTSPSAINLGSSRFNENGANHSSVLNGYVGSALVEFYRSRLPQ